jgi:hypothetical protein
MGKGAIRVVNEGRDPGEHDIDPTDHRGGRIANWNLPRSDRTEYRSILEQQRHEGPIR